MSHAATGEDITAVTSRRRLRFKQTPEMAIQAGAGPPRGGCRGRKGVKQEHINPKDKLVFYFVLCLGNVTTTPRSIRW